MERILDTEIKVTSWLSSGYPKLIDVTDNSFSILYENGVKLNFRFNGLKLVQTDETTIEFTKCDIED